MKNKITEKKLFNGLLICICALFWGFSFFGTTVALEKLSPMQILTLRWTIAAVFFLLLAAFKIIKINYKGKSMKKLLIVGILQPSLYSIFETNGISLTTTSESSIFIATIPLMVLIIGGLFLHKKVSKRVVFSILMAFTGVLICVAFSPNFSLGGKGTGYIVLIGAVTVGALFSYSSSWASEEFDPIELTFGMAIIGAFFFNFINIIAGDGLSTFTKFISDGKIIISILFLGTCCSCICYLIYNYVLGATSTAIASNLVGNSTTAIGVITGVVFAGDPFGWYTVLGILLTLSGIVLSSMSNNK